VIPQSATEISNALLQQEIGYRIRCWLPLGLEKDIFFEASLSAFAFEFAGVQPHLPLLCDLVQFLLHLG
jgi:hypothetical protein